MRRGRDGVSVTQIASVQDARRPSHPRPIRPGHEPGGQAPRSLHGGHQTGARAVTAPWLSARIRQHQLEPTVAAWLEGREDPARGGAPE